MEAGKRSKRESKPQATLPGVSELPEWMPLDAWNAYLEVRKLKKAPTTAYGRDLLVAKLAEWRRRGHDPKAILDYSTEHGYVGIFEPTPGRSASNDERKPWAGAI